MTTSKDPRAWPAAIEELTGSGSDFELVEQDVLGTRMTVFANCGTSLGEVLAASVRHAEQTYLVTADRRLTFAEHARRVASLSRALRDGHGVRRGDRVAIVAANSPEWIIAFWAAVSVGAVTVGCNAWWSGREIDYAVDHTRPRVVIADAERAALIDRTDIPVLSVEHDVPRLAHRYPDEPLTTCDTDTDDPAVILFTSGTSGRPKGVVHSHRNLMSVIEYHRMNTALARAAGDPTDPRDRRFLLALPLFHIAGLHNIAVPRLADGGTAVLYDGAFRAERVLRLIERERVTNWGAVPTMAHRLIEHGDLSRYDLSSLTAFSLASAPSSPAFKARLRAALPIAEKSLVDSYGLTESSTAIAVATPADLAQAPGTLGRPVATVQMEIRDPFGNALPEGEEGEICVRSPFNMLGYWEDPEATAQTIRADRWMHTGDLGVLEEGRLRLANRRSDLILRGGENVYPAEIENVLTEHPGVEECIVLGAPHADLGQEVTAVVVTREDGTPGEEELTAFVRERLAYFKVPSRWRITREALPRNATGKVSRSKIQI